MVEAEAAQDSESGGDMAMREGAVNLQGFGRGQQRLALQDAAEEIDLSGRPIGEIGESAFEDPLALTSSGTQEHGRG
jgi:hypothetical protein